MTAAPAATRKRRRKVEPFTVDHFLAWVQECELTLEDGGLWEVEPFQRALLEDILSPVPECWIIIPEGNAKTTMLAAAALYAGDNAPAPWIPIGAASRDQAEIMFGQAGGFVERSPILKERFRVHEGYRRIKCLRTGGRGIRVYAWDPKTGDGVIPYPFSMLDELHRHDDLRLYRLWKGKGTKRGGRVRACSTAGEPGTEFEEMRERIRNNATRRERDGCHLRAEGAGIVYHEFMVPSVEQAEELEVVKGANPLAALDVAALRAKRESETLDYGNDWLRLTCNIPVRSTQAAIPEADWDALETDELIPEGEPIGVGVDVAWLIDCFAIVPLWAGPEYALFGDPEILEPPRNGVMLSVDTVKSAFQRLNDRNPIDLVVMDVNRAEDTAQWLEDELKVPTVIDRPQGNENAVADYDALTRGIRHADFRHTGHRVFRRHVLNAIARRLPSDQKRFDRPTESRNTQAGRQDRRVIDALTAAGMIYREMATASAPSITMIGGPA